MPEPAKSSAFRFVQPSNRFSKPIPGSTVQHEFRRSSDPTPSRTSRKEDYNRPLTGKTSNLKTINREGSTSRYKDDQLAKETQQGDGAGCYGQTRRGNGSNNAFSLHTGDDGNVHDAARAADDASYENDEMLFDAAAITSEPQLAPRSQRRVEEAIQSHQPKRRRTDDYQPTPSSPLAHRHRSSSGSPPPDLADRSSPARLPLSALRPPSDRSRNASTPQPQGPSFKAAPRFTAAATSNFSPLQRHSAPDTEAVSNSDAARPRFAAPAKSRLGSLSNPLPDAFSPHRNRRGQERYVADGRASQVRGWIFDTSNEAGDAEAQKAEIIRVEQVSSARGSGGRGSVAVVKGLVIDLDGVHDTAHGAIPYVNRHCDVLLVGEGAPTGQRPLARDRATLEKTSADADDAASTVKIGSRVRLGPPCWKMPLSDERLGISIDHPPGTAHGAMQAQDRAWLVCAGWKVLEL